LAERVVHAKLKAVTVMLLQRYCHGVVDRLASRIVADLLKNRRINDRVPGSDKRIDYACFFVIELDRHLQVQAVVHPVSDFERGVESELPLDAKARLNRVRILVVLVYFKDNPVGRALSRWLP